MPLRQLAAVTITLRIANHSLPDGYVPALTGEGVLGDWKVQEAVRERS